MTVVRTGFGWIEIDGRRYDHDVVVHVDGSVTRRKKKASKALKGEYGHTPLSERELGFLRDERPAAVYIGLGHYGDLPLTPGAEEILAVYDTVIGATDEILPALGEERRRHVAVLHVTC